MDPISAYAFALEVQGIQQATFREASGFGSESQVIEFKEQTKDGKTIVRKIPGTLKWQNITMKKGMTDNFELWQWRQQVIDGQIESARKDGSVVGYDENGSEMIRYNFTRGWPCKWTSSGLNAQGNDPIIEEIEITHEGLVRVSK
ncbi:MAG TPA: phage tail protein [Chloroflexota bacterium]|nr:phage tail protein [Chloroflexota bacterium]